MHHQWLRQTDAQDVIIIFGGWAVGAAAFPHLTGAEDVLLVSDYRSLDWEMPDMASYQTISLMAWSFGVASYGHWQAKHHDPFHRKVAVAGSPWPVDDERGIPSVVFQKTYDTLSETSFQLFLKRVYGKRAPQQSINVDARREELLAIRERGVGPQQKWNHIWLCKKDRIFPLASLKRAWQDHEKIIEIIDGPHAPFSLWRTWHDVMGK